MAGFAESIGTVAPYYNLVLVALVIYLFIKFLKNPGKKYYMLPWKLLFMAVMWYVVEEILTVLNNLNLITVHKLVAPLIEMAIITVFIYALLAQKEYLHAQE